MPPSHDDLPESVEHPKSPVFQRRDWMIQRIARVVFMSIVLAALLGIFGGGPLAHTVAEDGSVRIEYDRFVRAKAKFVIHAASAGTRLRVKFTGMITPDDTLRWLPQPIEQKWLAGASEFVFDVQAGEPCEIALDWKPVGAGLRQGAITVDGVSVAIWTLVYP